MYILGLSFFGTDSAAALVLDGQLVATEAEAHFSGISHDGAFPTQSIAYCLSQAGINTAAIDYVVFYEKPLVKFERMLITMLGTLPRSGDLWQETVFGWLPKKLWVKSLIESRVKIRPDQILFCDHALSHAASAFFLSPFDEAAILVADTVGEWTSSALGNGQGSTLNLFAEQRFPHSLGLFAETFAAFLGTDTEGLLKLSATGAPHFAEVQQVCKVQPDGTIQLNLRYFAFPYSTHVLYSKHLVGLFAEISQGIGYPTQLAASVQAVIEEALIRTANTLHTKTGLDKLCISGAMATNYLAMDKIKRDTAFTDVFVPTAPGDDGAALGAALWAHHMVFNRPRTTMSDPARLVREP